ncbi:PP2C family protein-serine/threonine phosphatase [Pseudolysinimonas sp.]|uniref:PP2C family protein-serine/threonine phosphatase n=1 Tax=Pseudolysinimonas sp. TaxID=2680009 RepID=UPI003F7FE334
MTESVQRIALPAGELVLRVSAATDRGTVRAVNEDSLLAEAPVFAVADGMGGHAAGDRASRAAIEALRALIGSGGPSDPGSVRDAVRVANADVRAVGDDVRAGAESVGAETIGAGSIAGTTLSAVILVEPASWLLVNVGDSRVYGWDGAALHQLTTDHSLVQELQDAGVITAEQAEFHPDRNVVTRALGAHDSVLPDVRVLDLRLPGPAPVLLICSDGLTKELDDRGIAQLLDQGADADGLVAAAVAAGGRDNVTAVVVRPEFVGLADSPIDEQTLDRTPGNELEDTRPRRP